MIGISKLQGLLMPILSIDPVSSENFSIIEKLSEVTGSIGIKNGLIICNETSNRVTLFLNNRCLHNYIFLMK